MHELTMVKQLITDISHLADQEQARKIVCLKLKLGALLDISQDHFKEHFATVAKGSVAEDAELIIERSEDLFSPDAQSILLESMEIET